MERVPLEVCGCDQSCFFTGPEPFPRRICSWSLKCSGLNAIRKLLIIVVIEMVHKNDIGCRGNKCSKTVRRNRCMGDPNSKLELVDHSSSTPRKKYTAKADRQTKKQITTPATAAEAEIIVKGRSITALITFLRTLRTWFAHCTGRSVHTRACVGRGEVLGWVQT